MRINKLFWLCVWLVPCFTFAYVDSKMAVFILGSFATAGWMEFWGKD